MDSIKIKARADRIKSLVMEHAERNADDYESAEVGAQAAASLVYAGFGDCEALKHGLWKTQAHQREVYA